MSYLSIITELIKYSTTGVKKNNPIAAVGILKFVTFPKHSYSLDILKTV